MTFQKSLENFHGNFRPSIFAISCAILVNYYLIFESEFVFKLAIMRNKALRFLFFGSLILIFTGFSHKFYVSLVQVQFNPENKALEITMKIFTDDLEYAISGSKLSYGLGTETEPPQADSVPSP